MDNKPDTIKDNKKGDKSIQDKKKEQLVKQKKKKSKQSQTKQSVKQKDKNNTKQRPKQIFITDIHRHKDMEIAKKRFHKRVNSKESKKQINMKNVKKTQLFSAHDNDIWYKYVSKFHVEPDSPAELHSFAKYKFNTKFNDLSYRQCKSIYDTLSSRKQNKYIAHTKTNIITSDDSESNEDTDSDNEQTPKPKNITFKVPQIIFPENKNVTFAPFTKPETSKYAKYTKRRTYPRPRAQTAKFSNNNLPFSGCRRSVNTRHHSASLLKKKNDNSNKNKQPPLSSYINKIGTSHKQKHIHKDKQKHIHKDKQKHKQKQTSVRFHNYKIAKKKLKHQKKESLLSVLSYFDDTQSVVSELSVINSNSRKTPRFNHSFNTSVLSNIDGPFSILPQIIQDCEEKQIFFPEIVVNDEYKYEQPPNTQQQQQQEDLNIIIEVPVNPATEIFGNFLGALCGLCVPALDVISSLQSAEEYQLLSQYAENIDESGNAHTLLLYEQLDGVSLFDLKQQLQVAEISLNYSSNENNNSSITTQERIQRYFVNVVRKTFGENLPNHFSHDGRSMIRDAGFLFSVDMLLFNINRFPVQIPFSGKANANNLFISTDQDGDSVLYGLCNRFMGGHDIIDMPNYLVNGGVVDNNNNSIKLLLTKQRKQTNEYIERLERFLCVLSDYYQTKILPQTQNINEENEDLNKLLHGLPSNTNLQNISANNNQQLETKISHKHCIDLCLRPIANYLYMHCGFELIIIDEYNKNTHVDNDNDNDNDDEIILKALELYRYKLIDNMITLLCEGILIGIEEISDQVETNDVDTIIQDIKGLDENMIGMQLISPQFLKVVLKLFHSTSSLFQLYIEDSSSDEDDD